MNLKAASHELIVCAKLIENLRGLGIRKLDKQRLRRLHIISSHEQSLIVIGRYLHDIELMLTQLFTLFVKNDSILVKAVRLPDNSHRIRLLVSEYVLNAVF